MHMRLLLLGISAAARMAASTEGMNAGETSNPPPGVIKAAHNDTISDFDTGFRFTDFDTGFRLRHHLHLRHNVGSPTQNAQGYSATTASLGRNLIPWALASGGEPKENVQSMHSQIGIQQNVTEDLKRRAQLQNKLAGICEEMCKEVGAYPKCAQCPGFVAPEAVQPASNRAITPTTTTIMHAATSNPSLRGGGRSASG
jgi:hypothetical protein